MRLGHRRAHRLAWIALALLLPAVIGAGLLLRDGPPRDAPQRLSAAR